MLPDLSLRSPTGAMMCKLSSFLEGHGCPPVLSADIIEGVKRSFARTKHDLPDRIDLRVRAERLEAASREIAKALAAIEDIHPFLSRAETLSSGKPDALRGRIESKAFQEKTKAIFKNPKALGEVFIAVADACKTATDSKRPKPVLAKNGKAFDETRKMLGFELAAFWHVATKKVPTHSGKGVPESPATPFGTFVVLSAQECDADDLISKGFSGFVKKAREDYLASDLAKGVVTGGV